MYTCCGHGGHGPVETVEIVVCIVHSGVDHVGNAGPRAAAAGAGLAAQDVPQTRHKVGAHGYEHSELHYTQQQCSEEKGESL